MKKDLNISKRLQQQFKELSDFTIFSKKVALHKAAEGDLTYSVWHGGYNKKKGVKNEQVFIFPVRDRQLSIGFTINNQFDVDNAEIRASCKISNQLDEKGLGVLIYSEPMNYENFKTKLNEFISGLNNNHGLKDTLFQVFSISIPEYKDMQNYVMDYLYSHGGEEGKISFLKSYVETEIETTQQKIKDIQGVIYKKHKQNIALVSVEDLEKEILETEVRLEFLKKQLIIKNKDKAKFLESQNPKTIDELKEHLNKLRRTEDILDDTTYSYSPTTYPAVIKQAENKLGVSINEIFALRQKETLTALIKNDNNTKITQPKKRI